jgi:hypothetical protein
MQALIRRLLDLCLLRGGPQDLPYSPLLARTLVLAFAVVKLLTATGLDIPDPLLRTLASIALLLALPWVVLSLRGHRARYLQTLTALTGTGLLFSLLLLPVMIAASAVPPLPAEGAPPTPQLVLGWLSLLLIGWKLMINAHIYRHALDWPRFPAILLALALFMVEFGIFRALFPAG